ncbi:MAG: hypothetical protein CR982_09180 [Candidatus Cloacimonadota bacterium]|nr:MAG: hypothetical protein CR982_09180 [Candidatus Cloacimonadota bacterium]PIE77537.1 MAG: hypothetical protein CSA15_12475 [Candidatus Delongbacteria bacterium]
MKTDVLLNVFGKPWQTLLSIFSLLNYSDRYIGKFYISFEPVDVVIDGVENYKSIILDRLKREIRDRVVIYTPKHWFRSDIPYDNNLSKDTRYRHSVRYQYGWERSREDYVFITHNDVEFTGDILGHLHSKIDDSIGVGDIGQCWNCPLSWENVCCSENYFDKRLSHKELREIYWSSIPPKGLVKRPYHSPKFNKTIEDFSWPTPECRINEWSALINLKIAREITQPNGKIVPFGSKWGEVTVFDTGVEWFRGISNLGYRFVHTDIYRYLIHNAGKPVMGNKELYISKERHAKEVLENKFGIK